MKASIHPDQKQFFIQRIKYCMGPSRKSKFSIMIAPQNSWVQIAQFIIKERVSQLFPISMHIHNLQAITVLYEFLRSLSEYYYILCLYMIM